MSKNDVKIIFVDIDWTLLNHGIHDFDYESFDALKKAQENGVLVCIATARPYDSMFNTGILKYLKPDAIVCTNGGIVEIDGKIVKNHSFDCEVVKKVFKVCNKHHLCIEYSTERERYFSIKPNKYVDLLFRSYQETHPEVKKYEVGNVSALMLCAPEKFDEVLIQELPKEIDYIRFDPYGVDLQQGRNFKSHGLEFVLNHFKISKENAMAIGDDFGDISMFELVKYSVCMENGKEEVKKCANFITKHINDHGVKYALEFYKVI